MNTVEENRRQRLILLEKEFGSQVALAERIGKSPAQVSQWKNASKYYGSEKRRAMDRSTARHIEKMTDKPEGWLDQPIDACDDSSMLPKMTFQERLVLAFNRENAYRREQGYPSLKKTDVWKVAKVTSGAAAHWFNGSNGMDLATCTKVAPLLRVNPFWLFDGSKDIANPGATCTPTDPARGVTDRMMDLPSDLVAAYLQGDEGKKNALLQLANLSAQELGAMMNLPPVLVGAYAQGGAAKKEALLQLASLPESEMGTMVLVLQSIAAKYRPSDA